MGIFSRLADIINSNLNSALARAEDPEKMIRLMVQEMEETLVEVRAAAARVIADRKSIGRRLERLEAHERDWERKAELAVSRGREDLARGALREKAKLAETAAGLRTELEHVEEGLARYEEDIAKLEAKLREAREKQKAILARHTTAKTRLRTRQQLHDRRIDDAFVRYEQMERRIDTAEGEVESYDLGRGRTLSDEIGDLEAESAVEAELEAIRARLAERRGGEGGGNA